MLSLLDDTTWQMRYGERFALEGVLAILQPALAVEVGTADGGSLRRIAAHAQEVHCFDIVPAVAGVVAAVPNAEFHEGDSRTTLPEVLAGFEREGRNVDFVLIDGDHTSDGVKRDTEAVLRSGACRRTVVMMHDTANDYVRHGLDELDLANQPKVALAMLDFVPGGLVVRDHVYSRQCWNGLGLVILDEERESEPAVVDEDLEPAPMLFRLAREQLLQTDLAR